MRALLIAVLVAGCIQAPLTLTVFVEPPAPLVPAGLPVNYAVHVAGGANRVDQLGALYWFAPPTQPPSERDEARGVPCSQAVNGSVPSMVQSKCTFPAGVLTLHGRARVNDTTWWSAPRTVTAIDGESYTVAMQGPGNVTTGEGVRFTLRIDGPNGAASRHVDVHYWSRPTPDPMAVPGTATLCPSAAPVLPGQVTITCNMGDNATWYARGHVHLDLLGTKFDYWSKEAVIHVE